MLLFVLFVGFRSSEARRWGHSGAAYTSAHSKHLSGWRLHLPRRHQTGLILLRKIDLNKIVDMRHLLFRNISTQGLKHFMSLTCRDCALCAQLSVLLVDEELHVGIDMRV